MIYYCNKYKKKITKGKFFACCLLRNYPHGHEYNKHHKLKKTQNENKLLTLVEGYEKQNIISIFKKGEF